MKYVQLTINDWLELKHRLKMELQGIKQSFVRIGFALRKIDDQKLYERDGYKSIAEFAEKEYGLQPSTTSRFMDINREYSIDGYSEHLREEYLDMNRSQLEEMLKLPETDREMIRPETHRADIRELKRFNRDTPAAGVADDIRQLIEQFIKDNTELFKSIYMTERTLEEKKELLIPSGNKSYKKGLYFLMMYEESIKVKKFGTDPQTMTWEAFFSVADEIYEERRQQEENEEIVVNETEQKEPLKTQEDEKALGKEPVAPAQKLPSKDLRKVEEPPVKHTPKKEDPMPKPLPEEKEQCQDQSVETNEMEEATIPGQMEVGDYPELMPKDNAEKETEEETEEEADVQDMETAEENPVKLEEGDNREAPVQQETWSRLEYIQGLTEYGLACYLAKNLPAEYLKDTGRLEKWLKERVDYLGNTEEL